MKEAFFAISAVLVVSALALGILMVPNSTGYSVWQSQPTPAWFAPSLDKPMSVGQYSPAQYSYYTPGYPYATALNQCQYQVPCMMPSDDCLSGAVLFADGSKVGCARSANAAVWCGHYKIGWNGGNECSHNDPNTLTQCVCP